jgi:hypothetical protein
MHCKIKGVTHAPALRVHSAVLERLALATIVLRRFPVVIVSLGSSGSDVRRPGRPKLTRIRPTT